ncbi:STAS/SEC14 domain-containing protein [Arthrobacter gandavensis]|uniref:STAS/SEC14 domain-containing protein n=1 Tax=Arthrobacter gandavensis TaxID=169960 RepID=UPI00188E07B8|nr:STAS/SEC14 domain-containing protein [Arthrobacter gandavensis]MBF4992973.1 STAS/SEC14 domain-containing protein [Arthrobacter gandavensis]
MTVVESAAPLPEEATPVEGASAARLAEGYAAVFLEDGFVRLVLPPGAVITGGVAARAASEFEQLTRTGMMPLLLELTGIESITRSARSVFGSAQNASAVAVLGSSQVDRVIANFLLGGDLPSCPTKYFSSRDKALEWLRAKTR